MKVNIENINFPRTPHIFFLGKKIRTDLVITPQEKEVFLRNLLAQEKVDGNCIGMEFDDNANFKITYRNETISGMNTVIFKQATSWAQNKEEELFDLLQQNYALFGEWLYWTHTVHYNKLPSYFLAHDIYDKKNGKYLSTDRVQQFLRNSTIEHNPVIYRGAATTESLESLLPKSQFGDTNKEGIYLRIDSPEWNIARAKLVSPEFHLQIAQKKHWKRKLIRAMNSNTQYRLKNKTIHPYEKYT